MKRTLLLSLSVAALGVLAARPASATFHIMQIEQVIGGVDGNTSVQAIQLRMRTTLQTQMENARLIAHDAAGLNPIVLVAFPAPVANSGTGLRVLAATSNFSSFTTPPLTPDFTLTNTIPASYLAAGSLTFEDNFGTVYWRLSWGGASYTGTGAGNITNDADGNFNPPFALGFPFQSGKALLFNGAATDPSTSNDVQYAITPGPATFTRNNGSSAAIKSTVDVGDVLPGATMELTAPKPNPAHSAISYAITLPRSAHATVRVFDPGGRVVRVLVDRDLTAGRQNFTWDVSSDSPALPSGLYLLVLDADGKRLVRHVAYVRGAPMVEHVAH